MESSEIVTSLGPLVRYFEVSLLCLSFSATKMAESKAGNTNNAACGPPEMFKSPEKRPTNKYALGCATLASMTSVLLGYDIGVMSGAALFIKDDLHVTDTQIEILLGIINIYSLIGSAAAGRTSDWIGRRFTIVFAAVIFFVGALLMGLATNYAFLMVGRFVAGVGIGYALMIAPVYTAEVSPASCRGFLTSFPEVFINAGILLGYVSNFAFAGLSQHLGWRLMLGVGALPAVFLGVGVLAMPESPRWLVMQGRLGDAIRVLDKTSDSKEEAQMRLADIKEAARIPPECTEEIVPVPERSKGEGVWKELLLHPTPAVRRVLIAGIGIHFFQQASGIDAVVLYSPRIFEKAGITNKDKKLGATVAVGFVKTVFILVATFFLDKFGRRPLLLCSVGGMILSLGFLGFGLTMVDSNPDEKLLWALVLCIVMVMAYVAFFSIGLGPITWVYSSEIFPLRLRAQGCSMGVAVNRVTSGVISMTFISLYKAITIGGSFFLFAGVALMAWAFFFTFLPETQGKHLEEMDDLFGLFNWRDSIHKKGSNRGGKEAKTTNGDVQLGNKA
ncbi:putative polyol transporter 2 [Macadamia integrifolia]|uniref:putative polyol transporter 2 n=1 Tax=Macadamia integrifolia TaxID=60698 RepID=UPI001C4E368D|nr:putative polyol transporter 2 [Macadamia integrifolia]